MIRVASSARLPTPEIELQLWRRMQEPDPHGEHESRPTTPQTLNGDEFDLFPHQRAALNAWKSNCWKGILGLATGSGKTVTALYGLAKIFGATRRMFVVIAVPYQNLADQWVSACLDFGIRPIKCYAGMQSWLEDLSDYVSLYISRALPFGCVVVVNKTLASTPFQNLLSRLPGDSLAFIGDECHHHTTSRLLEALPQQAEFRLGLSATPEDYYDGSLTDALKAYYGPICSTYGLSEALGDEVLTPYEYFVHLVTLTPDETEEYSDLSAKISSLFAQAGHSKLPATDALNHLLYRRARLLGAAAHKLVVLETLLQRISARPLTLFYCGDGRVRDEDEGFERRQIDAVSQLLWRHNWKSCQFTAYEGLSERRRILDDFRLKVIDAMVAIRCLDEGIDVPACSTAFILASSRNPRQFIQRRGRILRRSPGKDKAIIHDFVVYCSEASAVDYNLERRLLGAELKRVAEFASLAENPHVTYTALESLLDRYDLGHYLV